MTLNVQSIRETSCNRTRSTDRTFTPVKAARDDPADPAISISKDGAIDKGIDTADLFRLSVREDIARAKYIENEKVDEIRAIRSKIDTQIKSLFASGEKSVA